MIRKPRGTMDILPEETLVWRFIENKIRKITELYGFGEIRTPLFEATELFRRGVGDTSDVVQKEMYTFTDRDERSLTLRPEGTASVVRALIENGRCSDAMPLKLWYEINCFRYEKPQAGRSREFFQFGTEIFGAPSAAADVEIISLASALFNEIGIRNVELHINSIGCPACRGEYRKALVSYFEQYTDKLCDTCKGRLATNPLRLLDCKSPICHEIALGAPKTIDYLCEDCRTHMDTLEATLEAEGIDYKIDTGIVRGLDYYTKTVFEFISPDIGAQSTICGGGRYDGLVKELGGPQLCAVGFGMGITRLILAMKASGVEIPVEETCDIYIAPMGGKAAEYAAGAVAAMRKNGISAQFDIVGRSLKAQMKYADKIGAAYTLIVGDSELETGKAQLKNMKESTQSEIDINDIPAICEAIKKEGR